MKPIHLSKVSKKPFRCPPNVFNNPISLELSKMFYEKSLEMKSKNLNSIAFIYAEEAVKRNNLEAIPLMLELARLNKKY